MTDASSSNNGWMAFTDPQNRIWALNTAMLIALVRADVRARYPPTPAGRGRLRTDLWVGDAYNLTSEVMSRISLPDDMNALVDRRVEVWLRENRDALLQSPELYSSLELPRMRTAAAIANEAALPKMKDFSTNIVSRLHEINRASDDDAMKAKTEAMLVEIAKTVVITGVMVLPVGWAIAAIAAGSLAAGAYNYYKTDNGADAVIEGVDFAISAVPGVHGFKKAHTGVKLIAIGAKGGMAGVKDYRTTGNVGSAMISGSGTVVVGMIGLSAQGMTKEANKALESGLLTAGEHRTSLLVITGFKHAGNLTHGTMTGIVEGKALDSAFYGAAGSLLVGQLGETLGGRVSKFLTGPAIQGSTVAASIEAKSVAFSSELASQLTAATVKGAADLFSGGSRQILSQSAGRPFNFVLEVGNQTLTPKAFVKNYVLRQVM